MEKLFPTGNQMIDPRICYANEPGFMHVYFPLYPSQARFICITDSRIYHLFTFVQKYIFPYKFQLKYAVYRLIQLL